ncbi:hypothetical protein [Microbacterium pygmaeum]|uniref:Uncharacterized protein n=1 Tax=Microbacterium pygmaeum TaxID=370764 RepID=A0A1G7YJA6_9MICO|nr:hypothetical protein [Microbacterium pygmaeum]SDG96621.1 hypothetical protein SAMN04489810_1777 [Microbacterium pygmaeum]
MTLEMSHAPSHKDAFPPFVSPDSLRELPTRRPPAPAAASAALQWEIVEIDRYAVRLGPRTLGYIDVVGAVFVALRGRRYDRAVEVTQTLVFDDALAALS